MKRIFMRLLVLFLAVTASGGCAGKSDPARFYQIAPSREMANKEIFNAAAPVPVIGVGPVSIARYLDRPQIVTRSGTSRLNLLEFDKWAEPLEDSVSRMILSELILRLKDHKIALVPWKQKPDSARQITITVLKMENSLEGDAELVTRWTLTNPEGQMTLSRMSSFHSPMEKTGGVEAFVKSQGVNLEALCQEIAQAIAGAVQ